MMICHQYCGGAADFAHRQSSGYRGCVREMVVLIFTRDLCVWSWPTLAKPTLAKTDFGQNRLWPNVCGVVWCCVCGVCVLCGVGTCFTVSWNGVSRVGVGHVRCPGTALPGTALPLDRGTALPLDHPNFRSFFQLSRRKIRSFLPSLGVSSWNFGGFCWARP